LIKWDSISFFHYLINVNDPDLQLWIKTCERGLTSVDMSHTLSALSTFLSCVTFISSSTRHNLYRLHALRKVAVEVATQFSVGCTGKPQWSNQLINRSLFYIKCQQHRQGEKENYAAVGPQIGPSENNLLPLHLNCLETLMQRFIKA